MHARVISASLPERQQLAGGGDGDVNMKQSEENLPEIVMGRIEVERGRGGGRKAD